MATVPKTGGYAYGAYNPYTHAPAEGQDYETGSGTPLFLPPGATIVNTGNDAALGNFAIIKADGKFFWFGHLDTVIPGAKPGQQFAATGSPETAGGYGHGAHLWFAVSKTQDLATNMDPRPYIGTQGLWSPSGAGATVHIQTPTDQPVPAPQGSALPPSMVNSDDPLQSFFGTVNDMMGTTLPIPQPEALTDEAAGIKPEQPAQGTTETTKEPASGAA